MTAFFEQISNKQYEIHPAGVPLSVSLLNKARTQLVEVNGYALDPEQVGLPCTPVIFCSQRGTILYCTSDYYFPTWYIIRCTILYYYRTSKAKTSDDDDDDTITKIEASS